MDNNSFNQKNINQANTAACQRYPEHGDTQGRPLPGRVVCRLMGGRKACFQA